MKSFNSLADIELELKKRDLQRQITREQIKQNYLLFEKNWTRGIFSSQGLFSSSMVKSISKIGIVYILKRLTK
ncbi:MAG: hypothetical protein R2781_02305 [Flavobacteriaceae bacterium]